MRGSVLLLRIGLLRYVSSFKYFFKSRADNPCSLLLRNGEEDQRFLFCYLYLRVTMMNDDKSGWSFFAFCFVVGYIDTLFIDILYLQKREESLLLLCQACHSPHHSRIGA